MKFTFNQKLNTFELVSDEMIIKWGNGTVKSYLNTSEFQHSESTTRNLTNIIASYDHYKYLDHISSMFGFIGKKIIKPYDQINPKFAVQLKEENKNKQSTDLALQKNEATR